MGYIAVNIGNVWTKEKQNGADISIKLSHADGSGDLLHLTSQLTPAAKITGEIEPEGISELISATRVYFIPRGKGRLWRKVDVNQSHICKERKDRTHWRRIRTQIQIGKGELENRNRVSGIEKSHLPIDVPRLHLRCRIYPSYSNRAPPTRRLHDGKRTNGSWFILICSP